MVGTRLSSTDGRRANYANALSSRCDCATTRTDLPRTILGAKMIEGQLNEAERRILTDAVLHARKKPRAWLGGGSNVMNESSPAAAPNFQYTFKEKLSLFLPTLRQRSFPRRNLFAGPFSGEFGFELNDWPGFVRSRRPLYDALQVA